MTFVAAASTTAFGSIFEQGRRLILELQHPSGAYPASPTFSAYRGYSWFRDGAFIADAMSAAGEVASASRFFDWCASVIESEADAVREIVAAAEAGRPVADERMLPTRFTLDGRPGNDDWWDFQLDGYGTWLWAVATHARRHGLDLAPWREAIMLTARYLRASWRRPCFDWWEEHQAEVHISTLGCIAAGLREVGDADVLDPSESAECAAAAKSIVDVIMLEGVRDGRLSKWIGSTAVDASLSALISPLDVVPAEHPVAVATIAAIEHELTVDGGVHRYADDTYYGGGQWPLLSCFLGLAHVAAGDGARAAALAAWSAGTVRESGTMPEQVDDHLLAPDRVEEWVVRWGSSADPLLWSYAMFMRLLIELERAGASA